VRLSAELEYDADPERVFAMLLDQGFQEARLVATGALTHDVGVEPTADGGAVISSSRDLPTDQIPDGVRAVLGSRLTLIQTETWGPAAADGSREGTLNVQTPQAPVRMTGTLKLVPRADGRTRESVDGELKAKIPVVGGRIEKAAEPAIRAAIEAEGRVGREWLADARDQGRQDPA
jgi:uncharacterized protein DUF2505